VQVPAYALPFDRGVLERDFDHDETSSRGKIQAGEQVEKNRSVYDSFSQSGDAFSFAGNRCDSTSPSQPPFPFKKRIREPLGAYP